MGEERETTSQNAKPLSTMRLNDTGRRSVNLLPAGNRSLVLDVAYEEFCQREEAGERLEVSEFCRRYPDVQHSLARMIEVHVALRSTSIGFEATEPEWPKVRDKWLDWNLVETLGRGAFSRVFLATEPALGDRQVVVKCTLGGGEEAFILGKLKHPNIVPIYSVKRDETSGLTGICMPFLGRKTLADGLNERLKERAGTKSPWFKIADSSRRGSLAKQVVPLIEKVARGLAAAHTKGILHGDIKPSNILIAFDNEPLLVDFNLSRNLAAEGGRWGGTPPYMAPEVLRALLGMSPRVGVDVLTAAADQYSLGIVAYELLTGDLPYEVRLEHFNQLPAGEWSSHFRLPVGSRRVLDRRISATLSRATAFDPAERFRSVQEFADELQRDLQARKIFRQRGILAVAVASAGITLGGAGFGIARLPSPAPNKTTPTTNKADLSSSVRILEEVESCIAAGEYLFAAQHLSRLLVTERTDNLEEWTAYCFGRADSSQQAKGIYRRFKNRGLDTAELNNNLGFCDAKLGEINEAEALFSRAIEIDAGMQAAYHSRALMRLNQALVSKKCPPQSAWEDLQQALNVGPPSARLFADGALFLGIAKVNHCEEFGDRRSYVREALACGQELEFFEKFAAEFSDLDLKLLKAEADQLKRERRVEAVLLIPPAVPLSEEIARLKSLKRK